MKIKVTTSCSGLRFSFHEGETVDVDKTLGQELINVGFAEEVKTVKKNGEDKSEKG